MSGVTLTLMMNGGENIVIMDDNRGISNLTISNVCQSNGVIQVVDSILLPH